MFATMVVMLFYAILSLLCIWTNAAPFIKYPDQLSANGTARLYRNIVLANIPGTCKIIKTDKSLPPWTGRCMGFKYCLYDYTDDQGKVIHDSVTHDTCWEKGHNAECKVTQVVIKDVRCLFDRSSLYHRGRSFIACLDSTDPNIPEEHIIWNSGKDPKIVDSSKCDASSYIG